MVLQPSEYRIGLINKIFFAATQEEVEKLIAGAMKTLKETDGVVSRFVE